MTKKKTKKTILKLNVDCRRAFYYHYGGYKRVSNVGTTKIDFNEVFDDNPVDPESRTLYFIDSNKNIDKKYITMYDIDSDMILFSKTSIECWNCHNTFETAPIGIPINYVPNPKDEKLLSRIESNLKDMNIKTDEYDYFETVGVVCSFPCAQSYITNNIHNIKFSKSKTLLTLLYKKIYKKTSIIPHAPDWRLLKKAGGHMTVDQWRDAMGRFEYIETTNMRRPFIYGTSSYIHEKKAGK